MKIDLASMENLQQRCFWHKHFFLLPRIINGYFVWLEWGWRRLEYIEHVNWEIPFQVRVYNYKYGKIRPSNAKSTALDHLYE